jgi:hypothetical protein
MANMALLRGFQSVETVVSEFAIFDLRFAI